LARRPARFSETSCRAGMSLASGTLNSTAYS
jgi:hypothetical protein